MMSGEEFDKDVATQAAGLGDALRSGGLGNAAQS